MKESSIKKDIMMVVLGAVISTTTALVTSYINEERQAKRNNIQKKLELNDQISKDLGRRLYLTYQLYRAAYNKDTLHSGYLKDYRLSKEEWNIKEYSYASLLKHYYSSDIQKEFRDSIYEPMIKLGQNAEYKNFEKDYRKKWAYQREKNIEFVSRIYDLCDE